MTTPNPEPVPVDLLDVEFAHIHRARWFTVAIAGIVLLGMFAFLLAGYLGQHSQIAVQQQQIAAQQRQIGTQQREITASCDWWRSIGNIPPVNAPGTGKPTQTSVILLAVSRNTFITDQCPGTLAPPSAALLKWAAAYHVTLLG
jgi:hypothetical protein